MDHSSIQSKISQVLMKFHEQLFKFTQVMLGIRKYGLLDRINVRSMCECAHVCVHVSYE